MVVDTTTPGALSEIAESDGYGFPGWFGSTATVDYSTTILGNQPDIVARIDLVRPNGTTALSTATCGGNARLDNVFRCNRGLDGSRPGLRGLVQLRVRTQHALLTGVYALAVSRSDSPRRPSITDRRITAAWPSIHRCSTLNSPDCWAT